MKFLFDDGPLTFATATRAGRQERQAHAPAGQGASSASSLGVSPGIALLSPRRRAIYIGAGAGIAPSRHL